MSEESRLKVLLVDDEKLLLDLYRRRFEMNGFDVFTATDPEEVLKTLRAGYKPDVILFDITMPAQISGYEFLEHIKKEKLGAKKCLYIALTNEGQDGEKKRIAELGADDHIMKSNFSPAEIVAHVQEMLKKIGRAHV